MNKFTAAKANPTKKAAPGKKPEVLPIEVKGYANYAQFDALEKSAKTMKEVARTPVIAAMEAQFIKNKGENYKACDGGALGTLMFNKRSSASGLSDIEQELLTKYEIPMVTIEGEFKLNTGGVSAKKLQEVSDAIDKVKGLPDNFIEYSEEKARVVTSDKSIEEVFKLNDPDVIKQLMPVVGTYMIKPGANDFEQEALIVNAIQSMGLDVKAIIKLLSKAQ